VKNIAFLMNKSGEWSLSPAFDMTYSFNPAGAWTASHQMTMNGKRENFTLEDFNACAKTASMKRGRAAKIVADVQATVSKWRSFAETAGVPDVVREKIQTTLNLERYS
jgi:serine/threonine-protein kinase HipA